MTWPTLKVGDVLTLKYGKALKTEDRDGGNFPVVGSGGVAGSHSESLTGAPAIVVGRKGSIGSLTYLETPCWPIDTAYYVEIDESRFDWRWIYWALASLNLGAMNKSAAVPGLNRDDVYRRELSIPPLPEQRRIASILDEAESIRAMRQKSIELLGQLTDVLFERPKENDQDWGPIVRLGDVFDVSGGKRLPKGALYASSPTDHPYLRVVDMKSGTFAMDGLKYLTSDVHSKISRYVVKSGDLVISIAGTIGSVAVVPSMLDGSNLTENAARLRPRAGVTVDPHFVRSQLASRPVQDQIDRATGRVTIGKLALFRIEDLKFRLPPLPLQREMALQLEQIDIHRSRLARHLDMAIEVCETLKTQAFRGEL